MPSDFRVVAIIAAHNEADIVGQVVGDLIEQGVQVYFLDDSSTDGTVAAVEPYLGRGLIEIEHLCKTLAHPEPDRFAWDAILRRKARLATELDAHWFIHHDADEFRESPWRSILLRDAIARVDALGYNAIDFALFDFWPVDDTFRPGDDVRAALKFYAPPAAYDRLQIRCWKRTGTLVDLASSGGHEAKFSGRRVFPLRFVARHYPIRSQAHAERKIFRERRTRFVHAERERGWHVQYDAVEEGACFIRDAAGLIAYDPDRIRVALELRHRGVEELETALAGMSAEIEARDTRIDRIRCDFRRTLEDLAQAREDFARARVELASRAAEVDRLQRDLERREDEVRRLRQIATDQERRIEAIHRSKSWRLTRPLRTGYDLLGLGDHGPLNTPAAPPERTARVWWGDLDRVSPISDVWGTDRGLPVDRHYIARFLDRHRGDIRGRVLEVKDAYYAREYGDDRLVGVDVLDIDEANPNVTLVADLSRADWIPDCRFDCFILTQTLHIIYDMRAALAHAARILKPEGVLLCTIPAVSRVNYEDGGLERGDFWRATKAAVVRLLGEVFGPERVTVETFGNVRVCAAFLYGLAAEELDPGDLAYYDPWFPLIHCVRAIKAPTAGEPGASPA